MIRRVGFSLKYKFIVAISLLLLLTMGFYLKYALGIFKEDKAADVYSITLSNAISLSERAKLLINQDKNIFSQINLSDFSSNQSLFKSHPDIYLIACQSQEGSPEIKEQIFNKEKLNSENIELENLNNLNLVLSLKNSSKDISFKSSMISGLPPHYLLTKTIQDNISCAVAVSLSKLLVLSNETLNYGSYLLTDSGKLFLKINNNEVAENDFINIVESKTIKELSQGTIRLNDNIKAFSKIEDYNLIAISEIPESKAFLASSLLINKSIYFGLLILSISVIIGILFTKRMTNNLQELFLATEELARGNFKINLSLKGNDEIAALSDSFLDMKDKILDYMDQMKEKARIENEVRLAKIVQDSFFPNQKIIGNGFVVNGHYAPATECSGDWWGYFEQDKKLTLIICDATGHGVSAALITATAHSVLTSIKLETEKNYYSPKQVLNKLNKVVSELNSEILMTAFVLEIDREKNLITYSNASHIAPFVFRSIDGLYNKESIIPLIENNGSRVGEKSNTKYEDSILEIKIGDRIILFSDGILEAKKDEKIFGQRNFIKSILNSLSRQNVSIINHVLEDLKDYHIDDDISLIVTEINSPFPHLNTNEHNQNYHLVLSSLDNSSNVKYLLNSNCNHLIGSNGKNEILEFELVDKLTMDFEYNLMSAYKNKKSIYLKDNKEIPNVIEEFKQFLDGQFESAVTNEQLHLVLEELLSNAFYHSNQNKALKRSEQILLEESNSIELQCMFNLDHLIFSVKGPGRFEKANILQSINRGHDTKTPVSGEFGAGLGLYMVYDHVSQLWFINNEFENKTRIVCVFENFNRNKKAKERITSFHFINWEKV